jgi:alpha-beta hydrolase superfamily lysophospholipase
MGHHGGDTTRLGRLGPGGLRAAIAACWQLTELIRAENPGLPLIILGHSFGSFVTQKLLNEHPEAYDAVVLSGSALLWPGSINSGDLNKPWASPDAMGTEWLASDLAVGRAFLDDPLTTTEPLPKLFGPIDTLRLMGKPKKNLGRDIPVLLMVGRDDTVGGPPQRAPAGRRVSQAFGPDRRDHPGVPRRAARDLQRRFAGRGQGRPAGVARSPVPGSGLRVAGKGDLA